MITSLRLLFKQSTNPEGLVSAGDDSDKQSTKTGDSNKQSTKTGDSDKQSSKTGDSNKQSMKTGDSDKQSSKTEDSDKQSTKTEDSDKQSSKTEDSDMQSSKTEDSAKDSPVPQTVRLLITIRLLITLVLALNIQKPDRQMKRKRSVGDFCDLGPPRKSKYGEEVSSIVLELYNYVPALRESLSLNTQ